jgi:hypothetical protein
MHLQHTCPGSHMCTVAFSPVCIHVFVRNNHVVSHLFKLPCHFDRCGILRRLYTRLALYLCVHYTTTTGGMTCNGSPDLTLRKWATVIRERFDLDNLDFPTTGSGLVAAQERDLQHTKALQHVVGCVGRLHVRMTSLEREMHFNNGQQRTENIALHIDNDRLRQALQQANADNQQLRAENSVLRASPHTNPSTLPPMSAATSVTTPWSSSAGACTHIRIQTFVHTCASVSSFPCVRRQRVREHVPVRVHVLPLCALVYWFTNAVSVPYVVYMSGGSSNHVLARVSAADVQGILSNLRSSISSPADTGKRPCEDTDTPGTIVKVPRPPHKGT